MSLGTPNFQGKKPRNRGDFLSNKRLFLLLNKFRTLENAHSLRELGSYILRDTPKPRQLKVPGPKPTIKQLKEARKGNGFPL